MAIFTNSSLAKPYLAHKNNYTETRLNNLITEICIHHMAGVATAAECGRGFQNPSRGGSAHYGVGYDGSIGLYVEEKDIAWANSNWNSNCRAVSIETSNSSMGGNWPVSDKALDALIKLVADIAKRNNMGKLEKGKNLTWHQMYAATACPGPYLLSKMDYIIEKANEINFPKPVEPTGPHTDIINGVNCKRTANTIVRYDYATNRTSTATNKYGYEIITNKENIIVAIEDGKGNAVLPIGGHCYSGHGTGMEYLKKLNLKVGNSLWTKGGKISYSKKKFYSINNFNGFRSSNYLCVYNKGKTTNCNPYGYEFAVVNNIVQSAPVYGKGHMAIPINGYVVSGHGEAGIWIKNNIKKGTKVSIIDNNKIRID